MISFGFIVSIAIWLIITLFFTIKIIIFYKKFPSWFAFQLLLIILGTGMWILSSFPFLFDLEFLSNQAIILIADIGALIGLSILLRLSYIFSHSLFKKRSFYFSLITKNCTSILIGLRIADMLMDDNMIYSIAKSDGWRLVRLPLVSFVIAITLVSFLGLIMSSFDVLEKEHNYHSSKNENLKTIIIIIILIGIVENIISISLSNSTDATLILGSFVFSRFLMAIGFWLVVNYILDNSLILFLENANSLQLLKTGFIGWGLVTFQDDGPTFIGQSDAFVNYYNIPPEDMMMFAAISLSVAGIGDSFRDHTYLLPMPGETQINGICASFTHYNPNLKDKRLQKKALSIMVIFLPNAIFPAIGNLDMMQKYVHDFKNETRDIDAFAANDVMEEITLLSIASFF